MQLSPSDGKLLSNATLYRTLVGSLIYLTVVCSDITFVLQLVSQFMVAPRSTDYAIALRISSLRQKYYVPWTSLFNKLLS